jgi:ribosomal peptide maturation radical SAM protein 1
MRDLQLRDAIKPGDCLIVVPPFAGLDRPSLAAHVLQACAREAGLRVRVLYANVLLAAEIGEMHYEAICYAPSSSLIGERFFASAAFDVAPLGRTTPSSEGYFKRVSKNINLNITFDDLVRFESIAKPWADLIARCISELDFPVVGCTTTFEQTSASVAVLRRVKALNPSTVTVLGGANCEGQLAEGIHTLSAPIDFVFSGESELTFPEFLTRIIKGQRVTTPIIEGQPCTNMDAIPTPTFIEFYEQYERFLPDGFLGRTKNVWLPYESSRGCWWGEKHHCTFCGINGQTMKFREKSPARVVNELKELLSRHPTNMVCMVDNIMPHSYFKTLLPRFSEELPGMHLFYEQKANLTLDHVTALKAAGVAVIQPGIEALSTSLLKRMNKGVTARQNVGLLRYARSVDLAINWNLLYGFPGDQRVEYDDTLRLLPLLRHLHPPTGVFHLSVDRFSPYFNFPTRYGVTNVRPMPGYADVFPPHALPSKLAYHFIADYESDADAHPEIMQAITEEVDTWRGMWESESTAPPMLTITRVGEDLYLMVDSRGLPNTQWSTFINEGQAAVALVGTPREDSEEARWAIAKKVAINLDSFVVPLATASVPLLREFLLKRRDAPQQTLPLLQPLVG